MPSVQQLAMQPGMGQLGQQFPVQPAGMGSFQQSYGIKKLPSLQPKKGFWGGLGEFFGGKSEEFQQIPTVTPEVASALQQLLQQGLGDIQNPYGGFAPIEQQAREGFATETIPGLAERFSALGSGGSQRSSAFQGALGSAGAGLERSLAALRSQYGMENKRFGLEQFRQAAMPQFDTRHQPAQKGFGEKIAEPVLESLPALLKLLATLV